MPLTAFPTNLDTFAMPQANSSQAGMSHSAQHCKINEAVAAIQAKMGVDGSTVATSNEYKLRGAMRAAKLLYANTSIPGGNTIANTTTEADFASSYTLAANSLMAGSVLRLQASGVYGSALVVPTLRMKFKLGGVTIIDTTTLGIAASLTNMPWWAHCDIFFHSVGASGQCDAQGRLSFSSTLTTGLMVNVCNTSLFTIDTTAAIAIALASKWSLAAASSTVTLRQFSATLEQPPQS